MTRIRRMWCPPLPALAPMRKHVTSRCAAVHTLLFYEHVCARVDMCMQVPCCCRHTRSAPPRVRCMHAHAQAFLDGVARLGDELRKAAVELKDMAV